MDKIRRLSTTSTKVLAILSLLVFSSKNKTHAQTTENDIEFITYSIGYSPLSIFFLGKTPNSQTFYTYFSKSKKIERRFFDLDTYISFGIYPFIHFDYEKRDDEARKDNAWGAGISPLGFTLQKQLSKDFLFSSSLRSGIIYMNKVFPTDQSKRLNFTGELSVGIEKKLNNRTSLTLGYNFHHISNAQTGTQNPGLDSNILFITFNIY